MNGLLVGTCALWEHNIGYIMPERWTGTFENRVTNGVISIPRQLVNVSVQMRSLIDHWPGIQMTGSDRTYNEQMHSRFSSITNSA